MQKFFYIIQYFATEDWSFLEKYVGIISSNSQMDLSFIRKEFYSVETIDKAINLWKLNVFYTIKFSLCVNLQPNILVQKMAIYWTKKLFNIASYECN